MTTSPLQGITLLTAAQLNAELKVNDAINKLESGARFFAVEDDTLSAPPNEIADTGDRSGTYTLTKSAGISNGGSTALSNLVDGAVDDDDTDSWYPTDGSNVLDEWIQIELDAAQKILEFRFNVSAACDLGSWKVQGSVDEATWTDVTPSTAFSAGGAGTITFSASAPAAYTYYRFLGLSGTTDDSAYIRELEWTEEDNSSMVDGDVYVPQATATGAWTGLEKYLLIWINGWHSIPPAEGTFYFQKASPQGLYRYDGSAWQLSLRSALVADLTDSTTGTPAGTLVATGDSDTNDNFASLASKVNGLFAAMKTAGLMATS